MRFSRMPLAILILSVVGCSDPSPASEATPSTSVEVPDHTHDGLVAHSHEVAVAPRHDPMAGDAVWAGYCEACHGPEGKGDGPAAAALDPKPADLSRAPVVGEDGGPPPRSRYVVIMKGSPGTAMVGYQDVLSREQVQALIGHMHLLMDPRDAGYESPDGDGTAAAHGHVHGDGRTMWNIMCANCHGIEGRGDGPAAPALDPAPSDLTLSSASRGAGGEQRSRWEILLEGSPGTAMIGWKGILSDTELEAIYEHMEAITGSGANGGRESDIGGG